MSLGSILRRFARSARLLLGLAAGMAFADPATVIIRTPAGAPAPAELAPLLARWRQTGQVANVVLLTGGKAEKPERPAKFGALVVLEFADDSALAAWAHAAAPALPAGLLVRRAEVLAHGGLALRDSAGAVFIVNTYTPLVSAPRFADYVQGYVRPLYEAMLGTGHLVRYTAYLERGETGRVDALNVLEYRDPAALAAMGKIKAGLRAKVAAASPTYARFDRIKDTLRIDGFGTSATSAELPPPAAN